MFSDDDDAFFIRSSQAIPLDPSSDEEEAEVSVSSRRQAPTQPPLSSIGKKAAPSKMPLSVIELSDSEDERPARKKSRPSAPVDRDLSLTPPPVSSVSRSHKAGARSRTASLPQSHALVIESEDEEMARLSKPILNPSQLDPELQRILSQGSVEARQSDHECTIQIVPKLQSKSKKSKSATFRIMSSQPLSTIFDHISLGQEGAVTFVYNGIQVYPTSTPRALKITTRGTIECWKSDEYNHYLKQREASLQALTTAQDESDDTEQYSNSTSQGAPQPTTEGMITLRLQDDKGEVNNFRIAPDKNFEALRNVYCTKHGISNVSTVSFRFDGDTVALAMTPQDLDIEDGDMLEVCLK